MREGEVIEEERGKNSRFLDHTNVYKVDRVF